MNQSMIQIWAKEANQLLVGKNARQQWKVASCRARATRTLYAHSYLPSIAKHLDQDQNLTISFKDKTEVVRPLQIIADDIFGLFCGTAKDKLALRKAGMVLEAQTHARLHDYFDDFAAVFGTKTSAAESLSRAWGR